MFIWSFRMSKKELLIIGIGIAAFVIAAILLLCSSPEVEQSSVLIGSGYSVEAVGAEGRTEFLRQFGWEINGAALSVREVKLPKVPASELTDYYSLQLRQGFDLSALGEQRVKLWTYPVSNHPFSGSAVANLITVDNVVVGGDITPAGGAAHGFDPVAFGAEIAALQRQTVVDRSVPDVIPTQEDVPPEQDDDSSLID